MAAVSTFVPTYQGLSAVDFLRPAALPRTTAFPMNAATRIPFYRCRNAIYHLFLELVARKPGLTVVAPDYNSGNEILAMRAAGALEVRRANVGDIGFNSDEVDLAMSAMSQRLLTRFDYPEIRRRRVQNYRRLADRLGGAAAPVFESLPDGVCPLFFPVFVHDKHATAERLRARGVDALEFWNDSSEPGGHEMGPDARFLRRHVLELPIHQDLTARHIDYIARQMQVRGAS
jgi:dTDP-4-amino-4,6-dideoxygalactose transaminase